MSLAPHNGEAYFAREHTVSWSAGKLDMCHAACILRTLYTAHSEQRTASDM